MVRLPAKTKIVYTCRKQPNSKRQGEKPAIIERGGVGCDGDNGLSSKALCMKSNTSNCAKNKERELERELKILPTFSPGQLLRTVGVIVALLVPENVRCSLPTKLTLEWWEETV